MHSYSYRGVNLGLHRAVVRQGPPEPALSDYSKVQADMAMS
jgi:hypothetical protein